MNKALLLIICLLLLRMMNEKSSIDNSALSAFPESPIVSQQFVPEFKPACEQSPKEAEEAKNLKGNIAIWKKKNTIPSPVSAWAETTCAPIARQQEQIYAQLQITKPEYQVKKQIVIAIIDTGIDYTNPTLNARIHRPDGWGLPENFKGFDLVHQDFFPMDKNGHGTHVAGIIAGLFPEGKLLPIKFYEHSNSQANLGIAIKIAVHLGADIINISAGGYGQDPVEQEAIQFAQERGVLIISAAGNDAKNMNNAEDEYFPAAYDADNIISVMANDFNGYIADYSNFGTNNTDISALGTISSYLPGSVSSSCDGYLSGTSQATPVITATVAMLWASNPRLTYNQVKQQVLKGVDKSILLVAANKSQGTINIERTISGQMQK
jgi:subtilisin family serine protease